MQVARNATRFVIDDEWIGPAIESKPTVRDAIAVAPDHGTEVRRRVDIVFHAIVTQHHIVKPALPVRHQQTNHNRPIVADVGSRPMGVDERIKRGLATVGEGAEMRHRR